MMYYFHIKTAQLYCHLEATLLFLFTGNDLLAAERGYLRFAAVAICFSTMGKLQEKEVKYRDDEPSLLKKRGFFRAAGNETGDEGPL